MAMMPVVAGVDGSEESLRAAEWAAREAQRHGAPLRLVSAAAMPPRMRAHRGVPQTVADELYGESVRALGEAVTRAEEVSSRLLIDASPLAGAPALAVTASGSGALMLVVGARGAGGFAAMLLGSVSRYAAMHAPCPLVVVREETSAVHREIVVGIGDPLDTGDAGVRIRRGRPARRDPGRRAFLEPVRLRHLVARRCRASRGGGGGEPHRGAGAMAGQVSRRARQVRRGARPSRPRARELHRPRGPRGGRQARLRRRRHPARAAQPRARAGGHRSASVRDGGRWSRSLRADGPWTRGCAPLNADGLTA